MVPEEIYVQNLELVDPYRSTGGCVVECGVWRGGMIGGIAMLLGDARDYHLFDSFEGLPPAKEIDGAAALEWQTNRASPGYYDNCKAERTFAEHAMRLANASHVKLWPGWFDQTIPSFTPSTPIDVLRLDGDWYDSTMLCLSHMFPQVRAGGIIIIDDYSQWEGCSRAVHDYLSRVSAPEHVQTLGGVSFIKKVGDMLVN